MFNLNGKHGFLKRQCSLYSLIKCCVQLENVEVIKWGRKPKMLGKAVKRLCAFWEMFPSGISTHKYVGSSSISTTVTTLWLQEQLRKQMLPAFSTDATKYTLGSNRPWM